MNILIINTDYLPHEISLVAKWLHGNKLYMITSSAVSEGLAEDIKSAFEKIIAVDSEDARYLAANDLNDVVRMDYVIGHFESDILQAARIRKQWKLPSPSFEAIKAYRDKGVMKTLLREAKVDVPNFIVLETAADLIDFVNQNGYPVLIKPLLGQRASGISVLRSKNDLQKVLDAGLKKHKEDVLNIMAEAFIDGTMYHIDGYVKNGNVEFIWPSVYVTKCDGFTEGKYIASCALGQDDPIFNSLNEYVTSVIAALPSAENHAFHAEVFHCTDGSFKLCEIGARPGGGPVVESIRQVFDINIKEQAMLAAVYASDNSDTHSTKPIAVTAQGSAGWLIIPNEFLNRTLASIPSTCPIPEVVSFRTYAKDGEIFGQDRKVIAEVVIKSTSPEEVLKAINSVTKWFYEKTTWMN